MINVCKKIFLPVLAMCLFASQAVAHNISLSDSPHSLELKPSLVGAPAYQLAKSYWLGGADVTLNFGDNEDQECKARGFTTAACTGGKVPIAYCGSSNQYHKCGCDGSVYKYSSSNCPSDSTPNGDVCDSYSSGCVCNEPGYEWSADTNSCNFYCSSNSDCGGSMVCNPSDGQCYGCLTDGDCGEGSVCNNNQCETDDKCAEVSCSGGKSCNPDNGQCECPQGQIDNDGTCEAPNCRNGGPDCSGSKPVCTDDGRCVECVSNADCTGNQVCSANTCQTVDRCKDVNCSGGKNCNPDNGQCECPSGTKDYGSGTCEAPNCANGGKTCPSGQTCNQSTKQCEKTGALILYSDLTTSQDYISGKTPIGIVFDETNKKAMAITTAQQEPWSSELPSSTTDLVSLKDVTTLPNCSSEYGCSSYSDGKDNTAKILAFGSSNSIDYPAASYCNTYSTKGTKVGDWYLPSVTELRAIISNKNNINIALKKIGINPTDSWWRYDHWASNEFSYRYAWSCSMYLQNCGPHAGKNKSMWDVRPVIAYNDLER